MRAPETAQAQARAVADWLAARIQKPHIAPDVGSPEQNLKLTMMVADLGKVRPELAEEFASAVADKLAAKLEAEPNRDLTLYCPRYEDILSFGEDDALWAGPGLTAFQALLIESIEALPHQDEFLDELGPVGFKYTLSGVNVVIGDQQVTVSDDYGQHVISGLDSPLPGSGASFTL